MSGQQELLLTYLVHLLSKLTNTTLHSPWNYCFIGASWREEGPTATMQCLHFMGRWDGVKMGEGVLKVFVSTISDRPEVNRIRQIISKYRHIFGGLRGSDPIRQHCKKLKLISIKTYHPEASWNKNYDIVRLRDKWKGKRTIRAIPAPSHILLMFRSLFWNIRIFSHPYAPLLPWELANVVIQYILS